MNSYAQPAMQAAPLEHAAPEPDFERRPFTFTGNASEYFRIWIVNTLLSIVTLGVYSAWAKVRQRQYFYRHTWVDGTSFEYLANPIQVLKGRLLIGGFLIALGASQVYSPVLYLSLLGVLLAATPWLLVKSLAFNARNSAYRNVRFAFMGTSNESCLLYFGMMGLMLVTCGFAYPYVQYRFTQFALTRHYFGDHAFNWRARVADYFRVYVVAFLAILPVYVGAIALGFIMQELATKPGGDGKLPQELSLLLIPAYLYMLLPAAYLRARQANLVLGGLWIGHHTFASTQRARDVIVLYVTNLLAIVFSLGLLIPWAQVRLARYRAQHLTLLAWGPVHAMSLGREGDRNAIGDAATDLGDVDLGIGV